MSASDLKAGNEALINYLHDTLDGGTKEVGGITEKTCHLLLDHYRPLGHLVSAWYCADQHPSNGSISTHRHIH